MTAPDSCRREHLAVDRALDAGGDPVLLSGIARNMLRQFLLLLVQVGVIHSFDAEHAIRAWHLTE